MRVRDRYISGPGFVSGDMELSDVDKLWKLIQKEQKKAHKRGKLNGLRVEQVGTGYLYRYEIQDAFPNDPLHYRDIRIAFCHLDGIIWDRSTRFVDPGAATDDL